MSRIPYLLNELSPWPRIRIGKRPNATAVDRQATILPLHRGSSQGSDPISTSTSLWARADSNAASLPVRSRIRERSTSFGSSLEFHHVGDSLSTLQLDREASERKVQELLKLRSQKLKAAERKGDEVEVSRLKNLNLFDSIEEPQPRDDEPNGTEIDCGLLDQIDHQGFTSQYGVSDIARPKSVNQGHTATLCWHLKLEYMQGLTVPDDFSQCTIHPTPIPFNSTSICSTNQLTSPSSPNFRPIDPLSHTEISSVSSPTLREPSEPSSPIPSSSSTIIASAPSSITKQSSITSLRNEEDPFLYIAKYIQRRTKGNNRLRKAQRSQSHLSNADTFGCIKKSNCTCTDHKCLSYLSGPPSKHCPCCKLPQPYPEIAAAIHRIAATKTAIKASVSVSAQAIAPSSTLREGKSHFKLANNEDRRFKALQADIALVEMYNVETEKRCKKGIWWEGWLIVEELKMKMKKREGVIGET